MNAIILLISFPIIIHLLTRINELKHELQGRKIAYKILREATDFYEHRNVHLYETKPHNKNETLVTLDPVSGRAREANEKADKLLKGMK